MASKVLESVDCSTFACKFRIYDPQKAASRIPQVFATCLPTIAQPTDVEADAPKEESSTWWPFSLLQRSSTVETSRLHSDGTETVHDIATWSKPDTAKNMYGTFKSRSKNRAPKTYIVGRRSIAQCSVFDLDLKPEDVRTTPGQALRLYMLRITDEEAERINMLEIHRKSSYRVVYHAIEPIKHEDVQLPTVRISPPEVLPISIGIQEPRVDDHLSVPPTTSELFGECANATIACKTLQNNLEDALLNPGGDISVVKIDSLTIRYVMKRLSMSRTPDEMSLSWSHLYGKRTGGMTFVTARRVPFGIASAALTKQDCHMARKHNLAFAVIDGPDTETPVHEWDVMCAFARGGSISGTTAAALGFAARVDPRPDAFPGAYEIRHLKASNVSNIDLADPSATAGHSWWCDSPVTVLSICFATDKSSRPEASQILAAVALVECGWANVIVAAGETRLSQTIKQETRLIAIELLARWMGRLSHALVRDWQCLVNADNTFVDMLFDCSGCTNLPIYYLVRNLESGRVKFCESDRDTVTILNRTNKPPLLDREASYTRKLKYQISAPYHVESDVGTAATVATIFSTCTLPERHHHMTEPSINNQPFRCEADGESADTVYQPPPQFLSASFPRQRSVFYIYVSDASFSACKCIVPSSLQSSSYTDMQLKPHYHRARKRTNVFDACRAQESEQQSVQQPVQQPVPDTLPPMVEKAAQKTHILIPAASTMMKQVAGETSGQLETLLSDALYMRGGLLCPSSLAFLELAAYVDEYSRKRMAIACRELCCISYTTCPECKNERFGKFSGSSIQPSEQAMPLRTFVHMRLARQFVSLIPHRPVGDDPLSGLTSDMLHASEASTGSVTPEITEQQRTNRPEQVARPNDIVAGLYTPRAIAIASACCHQDGTVRAIQTAYQMISTSCDCAGAASCCAVPNTPAIRTANIVDAATVAIMFMCDGASDRSTTDAVRAGYLDILKKIVEMSAPSLGPMHASRAHVRGVLYPVLVSAREWLTKSHVYLSTLDDTSGPAPTQSAHITLQRDGESPVAQSSRADLSDSEDESATHVAPGGLTLRDYVHVLAAPTSTQNQTVQMLDNALDNAHDNVLDHAVQNCVVEPAPEKPPHVCEKESAIEEPVEQPVQQAIAVDTVEKTLPNVSTVPSILNDHAISLLTVHEQSKPAEPFAVLPLMPLKLFTQKVPQHNLAAFDMFYKKFTDKASTAFATIGNTIQSMSHDTVAEYLDQVRQNEPIQTVSAALPTASIVTEAVQTVKEFVTNVSTSISAPEVRPEVRPLFLPEPAPVQLAEAIVQNRIFPLGLLAFAARSAKEAAQAMRIATDRGGQIENMYSSATSSAALSGSDINPFTGKTVLYGKQSIVAASMLDESPIVDMQYLAKVNANTLAILQESVRLVCAALVHWLSGCLRETSEIARHANEYDIRRKDWSCFFTAALVAIARATLSVKYDARLSQLPENANVLVVECVEREAHMISSQSVSDWFVKTYLDVYTVEEIKLLQ